MKILTAAFLIILTKFAYADTQDIPPNFIVAANVVWAVVDCRNSNCLFKYNKVNIDSSALNDDSIDSFWKKISTNDRDFDPTSIAVVQQRPIAIDEAQELLMIRIYSKSTGAHYFEVEVLGKHSPSSIVSLSWLDKDDVIDQLVREDILKIEIQH